MGFPAIPGRPNPLPSTSLWKEAEGGGAYSKGTRWSTDRLPGPAARTYAAQPASRYFKALITMYLQVFKRSGLPPEERRLIMEMLYMVSRAGKCQALQKNLKISKRDLIVLDFRSSDKISQAHCSSIGDPLQEWKEGFRKTKICSRS